MRIVDEGRLSDLAGYIKEYQRKEGRSPSFRQICRAQGFNSLCTAQRYVKILTDRGIIELSSNGNIELPLNLRPEKTIIAPLVGTVACGKPTLAVEDIEESFALPTNIFGGGETFLLKAKGKSMIEAGIEPGDLLVVKKGADYADGDMVIAMVNEEATAKRIYIEKNRVILHPENKKMDDIVIDDVKSLQVLGRVVNVIKEVHRFQTKTEV